MSMSARIAHAPQALTKGVKKAEVNSGKRGGILPNMAEKMQVLDRTYRELRQRKEDQKTARRTDFLTNEILRRTNADLAMAGRDRPPA